MRLRFHVLTGSLAILIAAPLLAQTPNARPSAKAKPPAALRTADGHPDLEGVWSFAMLTPLERPAEFAGKATLTDEEARAYAKKAHRNQDRRDGRGTDSDVGLAYNDFWWDFGNRASNQTSLIIDPPDGKLPALTELGKKKIATQNAARTRPARGPEDRSLGERCILGFNSGPPFLPGAYNNNVQIFQSRNSVAMVNEMVHNARFFPLNAGPHGTVPQWVGDSRAHWDGDTLVVDTTNFTKQGTAFRRVPTDENLHLIERFKLRDANTLIYEFTFEDSTVLTRPFTASVPLTRNNEPMYEYACHEGNYGMLGILAGARAEEAEAGKSGSR